MPKYALLKFVMTLARIAGWVVLLFGLWALLAALFGGPLNDSLNQGQSLIVGLGIILQAIMILAVGEGIRILLDIRTELHSLRTGKPINWTD